MPQGHTMIGVIGASDKTPLTIGSGNKEMHPVLLSLANIDAGVRMKATSHSFALAVIRPQCLYDRNMINTNTTDKSI